MPDGVTRVESEQCEDEEPVRLTGGAGEGGAGQGGAGQGGAGEGGAGEGGAGEGGSPAK